MKKLVSAITACAMIFASAPAFADGRDYRWGVDSNRHSPYYGENYRQYRYDRQYRDRRRDNGISTGEAVAIGIGALILGAAVAGRNNNRQYNNYQRQTVCQDIVQYDYYGNPYVAGRNCWQQ